MYPHPQTYHEWMLSEELRLLTASEPLSLEEEFDMQRMLDLDRHHHLTIDATLLREVVVGRR